VIEEVIDLEDLVADDGGFGFDAAHEWCVGADELRVGEHGGVRKRKTPLCRGGLRKF